LSFVKWQASILAVVGLSEPTASMSRTTGNRRAMRAASMRLKAASVPETRSVRDLHDRVYHGQFGGLWSTGHASAAGRTLFGAAFVSRAGPAHVVAFSWGPAPGCDRAHATLANGLLQAANADPGCKLRPVPPPACGPGPSESKFRAA
jgi:hypothetical protein